jgi:hypothetical protein
MHFTSQELICLPLAKNTQRWWAEAGIGEAKQLRGIEPVCKKPVFPAAQLPEWSSFANESLQDCLDEEQRRQCRCQVVV